MTLLATTAQQEEEKKDGKWNTKQPEQDVSRCACFFDFTGKFHSGLNVSL
jgi:hypothetical protein